MLALDKNNIKALFRYGKMMLQKGESSSAIQYLRRAQELSPNEKVNIPHNKINLTGFFSTHTGD